MSNHMNQVVYLALELNGLGLRTEDLFSLKIGSVVPQWGKIWHWRQEGSVVIQNGCH